MLDESIISSFDVLKGSYQHPVWDALWNNRSIGRIALAVWPNAERIQRLKERISIDLGEPEYKPECWTRDWQTALTDQLYAVLASMELPGDRFPAPAVPRSVHAQSQGFADIFGCRVEPQPDGNYYAYPLPRDPAVIDDVQPLPLEQSSYWGAVEWIRYAQKATDGRIPFRVAVLTGPFDTANYLLGTTTLLEWVYTEPETVHRLLDKITNTMIGMIHAQMEAAGGSLATGHFSCMRGGFDLCSEVRALLSQEIYEEFEAPYLRRIGEQLGPYGIHSCGSWERTIPSALSDPNLRAMQGQIKENDLATLCSMADGKLTLSVGPSMNVHTHYTWPDTESYLRHVLTTVPDTQPFETWVMENDLPLWMRLHSEIRRQEFALANPLNNA